MLTVARASAQAATAGNQVQNQHVLLLLEQSLPARNPHKGLPPEGRGKLLRCVCTLRRLTANESCLGQAAQTQPSCSRREATLDSRGLARTHHWGERDTSTLAGGKRGNGKGARPTMAFKEGVTTLTWPEVGHPPITSVS